MRVGRYIVENKASQLVRGINGEIAVNGDVLATRSNQIRQPGNKWFIQECKTMFELPIVETHFKYLNQLIPSFSMHL